MRFTQPRFAFAIALAGAIGLGAAATTSRAQTTPTAPAAADATAAERLKVADAYLELRTGAGRGYPVFHVAERDEWVQIELRHTDWYRVRTAGGKTGWVHRAQLERTLTEAGVGKSFRDVLFDDYLARRVELGAASGRFQGEPMLKLWGAYRWSETLALEGTIGQVQGLYAGSDYAHLNLQIEPWADRRLSPYAGVGFGRFRNIPNASLVGAATTDAKLANVVIGVRWHLSQRFMVRADYALHTAFVADERSAEYRAATIGLSFFF